MTVEPTVPPVPDAADQCEALLSSLNRCFADRDGVAKCVADYRRGGGVVTADVVRQSLNAVLSSCHGTLLRELQAADIWTCAFARDVLKGLKYDYEREKLVGHN